MFQKVYSTLLGSYYADSPINFSYGFQDPASQWMLAIIDLHDNIIFYLIIILTVVSWFFISALLNLDHLANLHHGNLIEVIWTITPAKILWVIGLPSLKLLYKMDEILDAEVTVKAKGSQWFWSYEYSDYTDDLVNESIAFDSFLVADSDLELGELRELTVDNYLVLPINTSIRLLVSSNDVIHSFAVPSLGIKADCLPGRLNSLGFVINRESYFYGGCSELCGSLHHAKPIGIKAVS
jgi:heme/copper-type cytochrome/quinol oxidase subunit 2